MGLVELEHYCDTSNEARIDDLKDLFSSAYCMVACANPNFHSVVC